MLEHLTHAAFAAGREIMAIHTAGPHVLYKNDCSPVTEADQRAEDVILAALEQAFPTIPVIAEEAVSSGIMPEISGGDFFLVDPLDGTKEFIAGNDDFTVNIALIRDGKPVTGVVLAPLLRTLWTGHEGIAEKLTLDEDFNIVSREEINTRSCPDAMMALISRSHSTPETTAFVTQHGIRNFNSVGSSLKFCLIAEGQADVYPRFSRTMLWDTAAGDAILRAAGGITVTPEGTPLVYLPKICTEEGLANGHFVAWGTPAMAENT